MSAFKCTCGDSIIESSLKQVPVIKEGKIVQKFYFDHYGKVYDNAQLIRGFYDYLFMNKDTIFVIGGYNDTLNSGFIKQKQILCVLNNNKVNYPLAEKTNFFSSLTFLERYFYRAINSYVYSYLFEGRNPDLPHFSKIDFSESGQVEYYEFNSGYNNNLWQCRKVATK
ncbi:hypothetical protein [Flavihumibacter petaseus]|uniref:Uncharacterized protein n=1 Tax=Flavihumibacter petaseus NBRC 106054 TaxID=1220578 RepID=A0A0E9N2W6_9BACT|nr:hypothetical protein [Flavihumibacter petaseus]GAO44128.1 hypothetical protein FPE01S_03_01670 [Flavihumibacter petaseus NBRC 106054]